MKARHTYVPSISQLSNLANQLLVPMGDVTSLSTHTRKFFLSP
jgi:precorrin-6B methylase 1